MEVEEEKKKRSRKKAPTNLEGGGKGGRGGLQGNTGVQSKTKKNNQ